MVSSLLRNALTIAARDEKSGAASVRPARIHPAKNPVVGRHRLGSAFHSCVRILPIAILPPDRLGKHLVLFVKANARGRDPRPSRQLPDAHRNPLDLKPRLKV